MHKILSMVNNVVKIVLAIACIVVGYFTYDTIATTIKYEARVEAIEADIIVRLTEIKEAQFAFKEAYGKFAPDFDTLLVALKTGVIPEIKQVGEIEEGKDIEIKRDTLFVPFKVKLKDKITTNFDSLMYVPHSNKVKFKLEAGEIKRNGVIIQVFEAKDPEPFSKKRAMKIGSMQDAIYTGNWEKQE